MSEDSQRPAAPGVPSDDSREGRLNLQRPSRAISPNLEPAAAVLRLREQPASSAREGLRAPPPPALHLATTHVAGPAWRQVPTAFPAQLQVSRTLGFGPSVESTTYSATTWTAPLVRQPMEFPGIWIQRKTDNRHSIPRSRVRRLLDALCGVEQRKPPRAVIVVAHPDDEAIGAGARLCAMPDAHLIHVTDGAPRDPAYALRKGFTSRDDYASSRQNELTTALRLAGVSPDRAHCAGVVDGEATERLVELTYLMADYFDRLRPEIVLTHPYEGGHTDHDATAFAVHLACGLLRRERAAAPTIFELTSYHLYGGVRRVGEFLPYPGLQERTVELAPEMQELKREMYDCFVSQRACLAAFPRNRERFRLAPRYSFTRPPHAGRLLYERVSRNLDGSRWRAYAARALEHLRARRTIPRAA